MASVWKKLMTMATVVITVASMAACGSRGGASSGSKEIHIGRTEVFDGFNLDQELLNESYAISSAVLEPLIRVGKQGKELEPGIAQSWEYNADNTALTIHLAHGVKFSNGKTLTAKDVAFSVEQWKKGPNYGANYSSIESTTIKDDNTIVLNLSRADTSIPAFLSYAVAGVVPDNFAGKTEKQFWQHPIGAGAFTVEKWSTDGDIVLDKNPKYYRKGYPKVDKVTNSYVSDSNSIALQLKSKQLDIANQVDTVTAKSLDQSLIADVPAHQTPTLIFNVKNEYLSNKKVRQAIGYALDYKTILSTGFNGYGEIPESSLPPNLKGATKASNGYYSYNVSKAKELLQGIDKPSKPLELMYSTGTSQALVQIIQDDLEKVGIPAELKKVDGGTWSASLSDGDFDLNVFATNANSPDLIDAPSYVVSTKMLYSQDDTSELSKLIEQYKETSDASQKATIIQNIDDYLTDEAPYVVLAAAKVIVARQTDLKGLEVEPWSCYYYDTITR